MQPSGPTPRGRAVCRGGGQFKECRAWAEGWGSPSCDVVEEAPGSLTDSPQGRPLAMGQTPLSPF